MFNILGDFFIAPVFPKGFLFGSAVCIAIPLCSAFEHSFFYSFTKPFNRGANWYKALWPRPYPCAFFVTQLKGIIIMSHNIWIHLLIYHSINHIPLFLFHDKNHKLPINHIM